MIIRSVDKCVFDAIFTNFFLNFFYKIIEKGLFWGWFQRFFLFSLARFSIACHPSFSCCYFFGFFLGSSRRCFYFLFLLFILCLPSFVRIRCGRSSLFLFFRHKFITFFPVRAS